MKELLKKQAILDIIVTPEHDAWRRLVSYEYDKTTRCDRFHISNGSGDHLYVLISPQGAIIKGFDHESCLSPYQNDEELTAESIYHNVPAELLALLDEETEKDDVTFCIWQMPGETHWHQNNIELPDYCFDPDRTQPEDGGQAFLMSYIFSDAEEWFEWASIYYELQEEAWDAAALLYETGEITRSMVNDLNPERDYDTIIDECEVSGLILA
ncbi:MAG: hypothetical protein IIW51_00125 [Peptococcaceae bacterium]|nr:hypothetical protein [Peptococcaceae bacterium]